MRDDWGIGVDLLNNNLQNKRVYDPFCKTCPD